MGERCAPRLPFPVVGIGASAGGLEAFTNSFKAMPSDSGMAFVLLQHLPPGRESMSRPTVILSDIGLPDEDGYSLLAGVRALEAREGTSKPVPAIAMTGYAAPQNRERALAVGDRFYLATPVDPSRLVAAIRSLVPARYERG